MKKRTILTAGALAAGALAVQYFVVRKELSRYNKTRAMCGEGPFEREELPDVLGEIGSNFARNSPDVVSFFTSISGDAMRYARIKSM